MDNEDIDQYIMGQMKAKQAPDGVSKLLSNVQMPIAVADVIIKGLNYDPLKRPNAMEILHSLQ